jgi:hypothetical protein
MVLQRKGGDMSTEVMVWWFLLCLVSAANVLALTFSARMLQQKQGVIPADVYASRKLQLLLSAGYVLGCAYRSALPVFDVQRICLFDSWLSSVMVGRSVATVAELCFVTQWALLMREIAQLTRSRPAHVASMAVLPLILVAEICSWYSVLTTSNIGHVIEESLWGVSAALLVASLVSVWPRASARLRPMLLALCVTGTAYVGFMFLVDVPMYWSRWLADEASGRHYLSLSQGVLDTSGRWVVSQQWQTWKSEVVWMSLYFSVAVWLSIAFIHTPALKRQKNGNVITLS